MKRLNKSVIALLILAGFNVSCTHITPHGVFESSVKVGRN